MSALPNDVISAEEYQAKKCPVCSEWIFVDCAPFAEGDRTKPLRDFAHYATAHKDLYEAACTTTPSGVLIGSIPWMDYNTEPVMALIEEVSEEVLDKDH